MHEVQRVTDGDYFKRVAGDALVSARSLLAQWFPDGTWSSPGIFQIGSIDGERGQSLKVWMASGAWKDYNAAARAPASGGDLISLRAAQTGISQKEAADEIAAQLGLEVGRPSAPGGPRQADRVGHGMQADARSADPTSADPAPRPADDVYAAYVPVVPAPDDAPRFAAGRMSPMIFNPRQAGDPRRRSGQFAPSLVHEYRDAAGGLIGCVLRRDFERRGRAEKETPFVMWCVRPDGQQQWCRRRPSDGGGGKLPLYGLDLLAARPDDPVLVVEGEKAADAGRRLAGDAYVVIGWPGGGNSVKFADWSPLAGRSVTLWPDADKKVWPDGHEDAGGIRPASKQPGAIAMGAVADHLRRARAADIRIVDVSDARLSADGWDLADGEAEGWTAAHVIAYIAAHAAPYDASGGAAEGHSPGGAATENGAAADPADDCPFVPVGHRAGEYYLLSPAGELRSIPFSRMNANGLESLTDGDMRWYYRHFTDYDERRKEDILSIVKARRWIMRACTARGLFDPATPVRGRGVWNVDNAPMVHVGDAVWTSARGWRSAGFIGAGAIYAAQPKITRPAETPASEAVAADLFARIGQAWNFTDPWGAAVLTGFIGESYLGQAPDWRANLYCQAAAGSGKSWLTGAIAATLGGAANPSANNYTEAALRQSLNGEARAILLDEAEPGDSGGHKIKAVIELIRHMSGLEGASVQRGSADGRAQSFHMAGSVFMASILQGRLAPQDRSRITTFHLGPLLKESEGGIGRSGAIQLTADLRAASPALWARAIAGWPRFLENMEAWRSALDRAGCSPRQIDQIATLFAARDMMVSDTATDPAAVSDEIDMLMPMLLDEAEETSASVEGVECWHHLLTSQSGIARDGAHPTVARLILNAMDPAGHASMRNLQSLGMRFLNLKQKDRDGVEIDYGRGVVVANQHDGLTRLFRDTRWRDGAWPGALAMIPGHVTTKTVRIDGMPLRGVFVPAEYLPAFGPGDDEGAADAGNAGPAGDPDDPGNDGGGDL